MSEEHVIDTGIEALYCGALQRPAPYYAKILNKIDNGAGHWHYLNIGVFERPVPDTSANRYWEPKVSAFDRKIGEYKLNYSSAARTFHPFQLRGKWYALYAKDYTSTRLMELPSCKDIGGEERDQWGFCPVDYWVPGLHYIEDIHDDGCPRKEKDYSKPCTCMNIEHDSETCPQVEKNKTFWEKLRNTSRSCTCKERWAKWRETHQIWRFPERVHGFVAGCVWGDDSSWKIEYLDLSRADEGVLKREARFGYIAMPAHLNLDKAVDLDFGDGYNTLKIATESYYDLATGEKSG